MSLMRATNGAAASVVLALVSNSSRAWHEARVGHAAQAKYEARAGVSMCAPMHTHAHAGTHMHMQPCLVELPVEYHQPKG